VLDLRYSLEGIEDEDDDEDEHDWEKPKGNPSQSPGLPRSCAQERGYPGLTE